MSVKYTVFEILHVTAKIEINNRFLSSLLPLSILIVYWSLQEIRQLHVGLDSW